MARMNVASGAKWETVVGYSRAVRVDQHVFVGGTTATLPDGGFTGENDAYAQSIQILKNIETALQRAGATMNDVVRTRIFVTNIERDWQAIGRAHGEYFGKIMPATSMVEVRRLIEGWMLVEIEADAYLQR